MIPMDPVELSGFLDRETTQERRGEIQQLVAKTASLRAELQSLASADSQWRTAARAAAFPVEIHLDRERKFTISTRRAAAFIGFCLAIRFAPKLADTLMLGLALNGVALVVVIAWVIAITRESELRRIASA
jgi:hypothetical protein